MDYLDHCDLFLIMFCQIRKRRFLVGCNIIPNVRKNCVVNCDLFHHFSNFNATRLWWGIYSLSLILIKFKYFLESSIWNSKLFVIMSRISFSSYMLNPLIIMLIFMSQSSSFHLDFYMGVVTILGFFFLSNIAAFVFTLLIEYPLVHIASYFK